MNLYLYIDASGWAIKERLWGALAVMGDAANMQISQIISLFNQKNFNQKNIERKKELKGRDLSFNELIQAFHFLEMDTLCRNVFTVFRCYPSYENKSMLMLREGYLQFLQQIRQPTVGAQSCRDGNKDHGKIDKLIRGFMDLKPIHQHQFVCILAHLYEIIHTIKKAYSVHDFSILKYVHCYIDKENFPEKLNPSWGIKQHLATHLQSAGMPAELTQNSGKEFAQLGAVCVYANSNSSQIPGIQYVDILLGGIRQGLYQHKLSTSQILQIF